MTVDDIGWIEWGFKGLVTIILTIGGWLWAKVMTLVMKNKDDLNEHKLDVAKNYSTKGDLGLIRTETNESLKRLHDRLDDASTAADDNFKELRSDIGDIKNLLIGNNHGRP